MSDIHANGLAEARRVFEAIFPIDCPAALPERFVEASRRLYGQWDPSEVERYRRLIARAHDLEAIELASRLTGRNPLLVSKFRLAVYLAECHPEARALLVNSRSRRWTGLFMLAVGGIRSAYKLLKGIFILRRVDG